jgi:hypothetical protein
MGADDNRPWSALAVHHPGFPLLTAKTLNAIGRLAPGTAAKNSALAEALTQAGIDKDSIGAAIGDCLQGEPPRKTQAGRSRRSLPASGRALSTAASSCFAASQPRKAAAVPLLPGGKWRRLTNPAGPSNRLWHAWRRTNRRGESLSRLQREPRLRPPVECGRASEGAL